MGDAGAVTAAPDVEQSGGADAGPSTPPGAHLAADPVTPLPGNRRLQAAMALTAVFLVGLRLDLKSGVYSGLATALVFVPVWVPVLKHYVGARLFVGLGLSAAVAGVLLVQLASPPPAVGPNVRTNTVALLVGLVCGVGVVLWARTLTSARAIGLTFGTGMLVAGVLHGGGTTNPWKFVWAVPSAVVLLSLADGRAGARRHRALELSAMAALAAASAVFDSRSYLATFVLAAVLVLVPMRPGALSGRTSWLWMTGALLAVAAAVYYLATTLLVDGYLGAQAQTRSIRQIETSGSLLLGGRPELAATLALMRWHPAGFGAGVVPTPDTVLTAKTGLAGINYDPDNGYVDGYMFGGHIELHSTIGDLWANFGLVGLALAALIGVLVLKGVSEGLARSTVSATVVFLCCWNLWNLFFSPLFSSVATLTLGIGLVLATRSRGGAGRSGAGRSQDVVARSGLGVGLPRDQ